MGIKTRIQFCDSTVSPTPVCSGCELFSKDPAKNICYAYELWKRWHGKGKGWPKDFNTFELFPERFEQACSWSDLTGKERMDEPWLNGKPRRIFLNDLGDSSSPIAPIGWMNEYIPMMAKRPHIWLHLTKWPSRMYQTFGRLGYVPDNFRLGTTVTGNQTAYRLLEMWHIAETFPEVKLWLSLEPLLAPFDVAHLEMCRCGHPWMAHNMPDPHVYGAPCSTFRPVIDSLVLGGASGRNASPMHPLWARDVRDVCKRLGIKFMFKQWGKFAPFVGSDDPDGQGIPMWPDGRLGDPYSWEPGPGMKGAELMYPVGKKEAGRLLDGREHMEV